MRILLINNTHSVIGGADRVYLNTGKLLESQGHDVLYFSSLDNQTQETPYSKYFIKLIDKRNAGFAKKISGVKDYIFNAQAYRNLDKLIKTEKPEIAHIHLFCGGVSSSVLKALKENNIPIVQTVHDYRLLCPANAFLDAENNICEKCINQKYIQCSSKRCVDGNFFYSSMVALEAYYRKYFINPVSFIDHFIFVSRFAQLKHIQFNEKFEAKSSHLFNFTEIPAEIPGVYSEKPELLYFGRLSIEKGILSLVKAARETGINLKIVGSGPMLEEIKELVSGSENIKVLGHQKGEALTKLIHSASFILVPSEWYENNPMTVLEAYALSKPVIASRIGGIPEIVKDGVTGFLFESRNVEDLKKSIEKALQLKETEYMEMSVNARKFAEENFSAIPHYQHLLGIYKKLLGDA
ncbi:MAG: glycosyltransferase [Bacteroidales bacterium]|nr:glycosyltransferase [Bacteroidales bacterium]